MAFTVYILYSKIFDSFYIGYTSDIQKRIEQHNEGLTPSTKAKRPWVVVYSEQYATKIEAIQRELFLKKQRNKTFYKRLSGMV